MEGLRKGPSLAFWLLEQEMANHSPWVKSSLLPVSINKVLLENSHANLFMYHLWLLSLHDGRVQELQQSPFGLQSLKYLLSGPL